MSWLYRLVMVVSCLSLNTSCTALSTTPAPSAIGSCSLGLTSTADDTEAVRTVLMAEGALVVAQKIDELMNLWQEEAIVTNAKNTPDAPEDDQAWLGKDAIRHRYVRTVFPGAPTEADPKDLQIQLSDDQAFVTATTQIGAEVSPAGDRWFLVRQDGCWVIQSLTYNLETVPPSTKQ